MTLQLSQIHNWLGLDPGNTSETVSGYSIDSRSLHAGDLFFAIRGPNHDGHHFVDDAVKRGAIGTVVEHSFQGNAPGKMLSVNDPLAALKKLASNARKVWGRQVVAITGSCGKTTTKNLTAFLLEEVMQVSQTVGNLNNEFGLSLSLLRIHEQAQVAVIEIGINMPDEMQELAGMAKPDIGVITNISAAHIGNFDSVQEIAREKGQLLKSLGSKGTAVLNADDEWVDEFRSMHAGENISFGIDKQADVQAGQIQDYGAAGSQFQIAGHVLKTSLPGRHNIYNILAGIAVARTLGIDIERLIPAIENLKPASLRGTFQKTGDVSLIDDCYNANPAAMKAMLDVLVHTTAKRRIAVLGEMRELGEKSLELHRATGMAVRQAGIDYLVAVGGDAAAITATCGVPSEFHETPQSVADSLAPMLQPGDVVLLKASRGVGLELARDMLLERLNRPQTLKEMVN